MRPFSLLVKPAGPDCNLVCKYCFYSGKTAFFGSGSHRMSDEVLEKLICDYLGMGFDVNGIAWQGGEPTLMGLDFYEKVVELEKKHGRSGQIISNALQTNATMLDEKWCQFLHDYEFLVGVSLDGPKKFNDYYRIDRAGNGGYERAMAAVDMCRDFKVEFNILALLTNVNVDFPDELFDFFVQHDLKYLQFIPCVEIDTGTNKPADYSITARQYGDFLIRIFDRWREYGPTRISIQMFDSILCYLLNGRHSLCTFNNSCNDYVVVEFNGDVFCCDFFVEKQYKLGNILESRLVDLYGDTVKREFAWAKRPIGNKCFVCRHKSICQGGCLKERLVMGNLKSESCFCDAYKQFFDYSIGKFMQILAELK
jgi:uncharacterized protein